MGIDNAVMQALLGTGVAHYPDEKLYKAASLLTQDERPNVPVRFLPENHPLLRLRPHVEGLVDHPNQQILMKRSGPAYQTDLRLLAALMAHEGSHMKEPPAHAEGAPVDEPTAYKTQRDVLRRLKFPDASYMRDLEDRIANEEVAYRKQIERKALLSKMKK